MEVNRINYPPGYRFVPTDQELIIEYLMKKISNQPIPLEDMNEVDLYKYNPQTLAERYPKLGNNVWYFFTPREKKYPKGGRPSRKAGTGYWKATGADKEIEIQDTTVGLKKVLVFYELEGKPPPKGEKTNWIMHEYRVPDDEQHDRAKKNPNNMRLDDWVLCKVYEKKEKPPNNKKDGKDSVEKTNADEEIGTPLTTEYQNDDNPVDDQEYSIPPVITNTNIDQYPVEDYPSTPITVWNNNVEYPVIDHHQYPEVGYITTTQQQARGKVPLMFDPRDTTPAAEVLRSNFDSENKMLGGRLFGYCGYTSDYNYHSELGLLCNNNMEYPTLLNKWDNDWDDHAYWSLDQLQQGHHQFQGSTSQGIPNDNAPTTPQDDSAPTTPQESPEFDASTSDDGFIGSLSDVMGAKRRKFYNCDKK